MSDDAIPVTSAAAVATPAANHDMTHSVTKLDRSIKQRRNVDETLINWWLFHFIVNPVTFGVYGIILYFKRINRIDRFGARKRAYYESLLEWSERFAIAQGKEADVRHDIDDLKQLVSHTYGKDLRPIKAGISFVLTFVTLGIYGFFVLYRMSSSWWNAQVLEQDFDDKLSQVWTRLGLLKYPLNFNEDQSKRRSFGLYLVLTFITFGIWGLIWDYKIHTDPDNLFNDFHAIEDSVLQTVRAN